MTIFPVDGPAIVYLQDGSSFTVNEQQEKSFQLIDEGFCSISDAPPDQDEIPPFVQAMIDFWQEMAAKVREEIQDPTATPV